MSHRTISLRLVSSVVGGNSSSKIEQLLILASINICVARTFVDNMVMIMGLSYSSNTDLTAERIKVQGHVGLPKFCQKIIVVSDGNANNLLRSMVSGPRKIFPQIVEFMFNIVLWTWVWIHWNLIEWGTFVRKLRLLKNFIEKLTMKRHGQQDMKFLLTPRKKLHDVLYELFPEDKKFNLAR